MFEIFRRVSFAAALMIAAGAVDATEPPVVDNEQPLQPVRTVRLQEQWRVGGADADLMFGLMVISSFTAFAVLYALLGVAAATWVPAQRVMLANSTAEREHGEALGRLAAFQGLVGFPAPFIGGLLYDAFGFRAPLLAGIVGIVATTVMLVMLVKEPPVGNSLEP